MTNGNPNINDFLQFFQNTFNADLKAKKKPHYHEFTPPAWQSEHQLAIRETKDQKFITTFRIYIKGPTRDYPTSAIFVQMKGNGSVYTRLNNIEELEALFQALSIAIPQARQKLQDLKPLEASMQIANAAFKDVFESTRDFSYDDEYASNEKDIEIEKEVEIENE